MSMSEPVRVDQGGKPLGDTWSNYSRRHKWLDRGLSRILYDEDDKEYPLRDMFCLRCSQTREVLATAVGYMWGCPRVPWFYRLKLWLRREELPEWSVNSRPPWRSR